MNTNKGTLQGGPADGVHIEVDPIRHRTVYFNGHWYYREVSNKDMDTAASRAAISRGDEFRYLHNPTCCAWEPVKR